MHVKGLPAERECDTTYIVSSVILNQVSVSDEWKVGKGAHEQLLAVLICAGA